jgi:hypothetical protein
MTVKVKRIVGVYIYIYKGESYQVKKGEY